MIRVVLRWLDSPWAFELLPGLNRLGRNPTNDFRISDPSVSSFHAELTVEGEQIRVRDLGSTNGTFIDEQRVEEGILGPTNKLRLGNVSFILEEVAVTPPPPASPSETADTAVYLAAGCVYHPGTRGAFKCENCGSVLCQVCVTVMGQGKFSATTVCPVCKGQCYPLITAEEPQSPSLLHRLTQTLRIPFSR